MAVAVALAEAESVGVADVLLPGFGEAEVVAEAPGAAVGIEVGPHLVK